MTQRLSFAYPDEYMDASAIPGLLALPPLDAPTCDHFLAQARHARAGDLVVPLSEEGAIALVAGKLSRLDRVDRVRQWSSMIRRATVEISSGVPIVAVLPQTIPCGAELVLPPWPGPTWLKNGYSTLGVGVDRVEDDDFTGARERILDWAAAHHSLVFRLTGQDPSRSWLIQEHVEGEQFEANLALADGEVLRGPVLHQRWRGREIVEYTPADEEEISDLTLGLARALGARWTFVCAEWRRTAKGWRLLELHLRPGDDAREKGYPGRDWVPRACAWMLRAWDARE